MKTTELRERQAEFESNIKMLNTRKAHLKEIQKEFVNYFTTEKIKKMTVEDYVLGLEKPERGFNFCYGLETQLKGLGWMVGGTSKKFGFWFGKLKHEVNNKYRYTKQFGNSPKTALEVAKGLILDLLEAGKDKDLNRIDANKLSPMFKGKILSTYYPKRYLNIFAKEHLDHFLTLLDLATPELKKQHEVWKREALLEYKKSDIVMKSWTIDIFSDFLYELFPIPPKKSARKKVNPALKDYLPLLFPEKQILTVVDLTIQSITGPKAPQANKSRQPPKEDSSNPDYESEQKRYKQLGDKGEQLVLDFERKRLLDAGYSNLAKKVAKVKRDSDGFDITSFKEDGTPIQIEVKATRAKVGQANFFLSINELNQAKMLPNYYIFMVFEVLTENPKLWMAANPFQPENSKVLLSPISYRVQINTK
jgi:hypothetical protein